MEIKETPCWLIRTEYDNAGLCVVLCETKEEAVEIAQDRYPGETHLYAVSYTLLEKK